MSRADVQAGAALRWLREAFGLINQGAIGWAGLSCGFLAIWLVFARVPGVREAVFVLSWLALLGSARRRDCAARTRTLGCRVALPGILIMTGLLLALGAFTRKALPEAFAQAAPFIQSVGRYHLQAFDFLMVLALLEGWMLLPLMLFARASLARSARSCLESWLDLGLALEWMKAGAMFLGLLLASLLVGGFLIPLVMAWMAAFTVVAYRHLYEN